MSFLVSDILDYSKIEAGKLTLYYDKLDPHRMITETTNMLMFSTRQKGIDLLLRIDPNVPKTFITDETRFKQILINLISNAIKFTFVGSIEVNAELYSSKLDGEGVHKFLKVTVKDTGIGMSKEDSKALFNLFGKLNDNNKINKSGTGLGLFISK